MSLIEFVVEEAFVARGPGVLLMPRITASEALTCGKLVASIHRPDGRVLEARASLDIAHIRGTLDPYAMVRLGELTPEDIPCGSVVVLRSA